MLSDNTNHNTSSSGGVSMLSSNFKQPVVSQTSVSSGLFHSLKILSDFCFQNVSGGMDINSVSEVSSSVEEPFWNVVLLWFDDNFRNQFPGIALKGSGSDIYINIGNLANGVSKSSTNSSDGSKSISNDSLTNNVGVLYSDNMLEFFWLFTYETLTHVFSFINF